MQTFPLNYFSALRTPTQVFAGRKLLSWPKFFLIFVFLVSLMVMPVTLFYANQIDRNADNQAPNAKEPFANK